MARTAHSTSAVRRCFLFTDIVDSTAHWESDPDGMAASLRLHDRIVRSCIETNGGWVMSNPGDGFSAVFHDDADAIRAALDVQRQLAAAEWAGGPTLHVRAGMESGVAEHRDDNFFGPTVNRSARVADAGHGGQILIGPNVVRPDDVTVRSLGEYRLKGVERPVPIAQIGDGEFARLRVLDSRRSNLPAQPNDLVGRDDDQEAVESLLARTRLVTVNGMGGIGKTRLTQAVGESLLGRYDDGVWFVELAGCRDLRSVISATSAALGVPVPDDAFRLGELVHGHDLLLVLDNCEHVVDDVRQLCRAMLATSSRLRILTSSRERLGVTGELVFDLDPLASTDDAATVFGHRAAAAGVDVSQLDPAVAAEICDRLDRIPLAIELAAATCRVLAPEQVLERLDRRFELLRGDARTVERGRHETLRGAIDWSYESLDETQQRLFRQLSVFNGGCTLDAVEAIADDIDTPVLFVLTDLVDRSMVTVTRHGPQARYRMLETIRVYARERSEELGETAESMERHVTWCRQLIEATTEAAAGDGEGAAIDRIVRETGNLTAAVDRLRRFGRHRDAADLVVRLDDLAYSANPLAELVQPLVADGTVDAHPDRQRLLGIELIRRSTADGTEGRAELAAELFDQLGPDDPGSLQIPVMLIANALQESGDGEALAALHHRARSHDDPAERARLLVAALLGTFFSPDQAKPRNLVVEAIDAARASRLTRLLIPIGAAACMGGLHTGEHLDTVDLVRPLLDHLVDLPTPSIMSSGFTVTYTELAVRAGSPLEDRVAAVRHLGPVLQGDFNRLGLALARLVQQEGDHDVAVQAVGACSRSGRSTFSARQIESILADARIALGPERVDALLSDGAKLERSDLYRSMWSNLEPAFEAAAAAG